MNDNHNPEIYNPVALVNTLREIGERAANNRSKATCDAIVGLVLEALKLPPVEKQRFASTAWMVGDVTPLTRLTDEEAAAWLENNGKHIRDAMVQHVNETVLPTLLSGDHLLKSDDDEKDEEDES